MSYPDLVDWISDNEMDLLDQYTQTDKGYKELENFLFSKEGEKVLMAVFQAFLNTSKARMKFDEWAINLYNDRGAYEED